MSAVLARIAAHTPPRLIRLVGHLEHAHPRVRHTVRRITARWLSEDQTIARGAGKGLRFNANNGIASYLVGTAEPEVQDALSRLLRPGDIVYDIGASIGFLTVICARLVGADGVVVAFEPSERAGRQLLRNAELNNFDNVELVAKAVSDQSGNVRMRDEGELMWGSLDEQGRHLVEATTVDQEIASGRPIPQLVKIDVEGHEVRVLGGMRDTLIRHGPIVLCELHDTHADVRRELEACGYRVDEIDVSPDRRLGYVIATRLPRS